MNNFRTDRFYNLQSQVAPCSIKWKLRQTFYSAGKTSKLNCQDKQTPSDAAGCKKCYTLAEVNGASIFKQFCITFISCWCSYTYKYRGYINFYKSRRDKRCMDNNWERVQKNSAERANPSELAQESSRNFLVTFLNMLRKWCQFLQIEFS